MTFLVTGGAGYIGSHCVLSLLEKGYDVVVFDNLSVGHSETVDTLRALGTKGKLVDFVDGDLLDRKGLDSLFSDHKIEAVFHFAAFSQVNESMTNPAKYYRNNVSGTMNLLDSMVEHDVKKIVFSSTAATYGEPEYTPIDEGHPQKPINPYGTTKLTIEHMLDDYDKAYGLKSVRLRYFNVVGADHDARIGEWHEPETHLVPNILKSVGDSSKRFSLFGDDYPTRDGTCVRDYINVEDLIDAHILAYDYLAKGGNTDFFNLGTNEGYTVLEIFETCKKVTGCDIPLDRKGRRAGDPAVLIADNKKAKSVLGWEPKRSLEDSIDSAYRWELKRR